MVVQVSNYNGSVMCVIVIPEESMGYEKWKRVKWLDASGIFIPTASLVLVIQEHKSINDSAKQGKKLETVSTVKLPKNILKSQNLQEQCVFSVIEILAVHFAQ
ncbi:unnamed protein product [Eruca vesicaria subsp. sativa]|uniref:Uncharacterized protein n=1 Tax=Eruca vesicaria subsp. sativa TaxID=29727 RepID=A0ABC8JD32_ERUVS|nr:unnamed protein product [Eruca vesicaria subsp. sativa]